MLEEHKVPPSPPAAVRRTNWSHAEQQAGSSAGLTWQCYTMAMPAPDLKAAPES